MSETPSPLDPDHAAFIQSGVSVIAASRNGRNETTLTRALGCRVSADRCHVTVFVSATQSGALLADVRANGAVAVVFSQPSTHRTIQLKGTDAAVGELVADDPHLIADYRRRMVTELRHPGFDEPFTRALLSAVPGDIVAVTFTPSAAFLQTPGPKAGTPLKAGT